MNSPRWKLIKQLITIYGDLLTTILVTLVFIPAVTIHLFEDMDISFMKVFGITIILFLAFVCLLIFILYAYSRFVKLLKSNIVLETTTMKQIPDSVSQEQLESDLLYQFIILASTLWLLSFHASPPWDDVCRVAQLVLFVVFAW